MALFNYATRELSAKIVYYGPGLSGKTTNIAMVHRMLRPEQKGRLISLPTETDRTLFFDFLPLELGEIKGFKVRFHLYTVPGQVFYNATRRLVLQGVDGIVFVADSQTGMMGSNVESLKNLADNLATYGKKLADIPFVMQYNKRDLRAIASVPELDRMLNSLKVPVFEGIAKDGVGVTETLVAISRRVFDDLRRNLLMPGEMAASDELGDLADVTIGEKFRVQEEAGREAAGAEPFEVLEELSDFEELEEPSEIEEEVELELGEPVPREPPAAVEPPGPAYAAEEEAAGEVDIELPETLRAPEAERAVRTGFPPEAPRAVEELPPREAPEEAEAAERPRVAAAEEEEFFEEVDIELPETLRAPEAERAVRTGFPPEAPRAVEELPPREAPEEAEAAERPRVAAAEAEKFFEEIDIELPDWLRAPEAERAVRARIPVEAEGEVEEPPPREAREAAKAAEPPAAVEPPGPAYAAEEEAAGEVDIELPETLRAPEAERAVRTGISVEAEGRGLTFLKFEKVFVSPEGDAVLRAVFLDSAGTPVRARIRVSLEEDRE